MDKHSCLLQALVNYVLKIFMTLAIGLTFQVSHSKLSFWP